MPKVKPHKGKRAGTERVGFDNWNLEVQALKGAIDELIKEGLKMATRDYDVDVFLTDCEKLEFYVRLPIGEWEDEGPTWEFNLKQMVEDEIYLCENDNKTIAGEEERGRLTALSHALGELQDEIDRALSRT